MHEYSLLMRRLRPTEDVSFLTLHTQEQFNMPEAGAAAKGVILVAILGSNVICVAMSARCANCALPILEGMQHVNDPTHTNTADVLRNKTRTGMASCSWGLKPYARLPKHAEVMRESMHCVPAGCCGPSLGKGACCGIG